MAEEALRSTSPRVNFHRLTLLLMHGGRQLLRETFDSIHSPADLPLRLADPAIKAQLRGARLTRPEMNCLYPSPGVYGKSNDFSIILIFKLFRTICGLTPPPGLRGWDDLPNGSDHTLVADLVRIKYYRNEIYDHCSTTEISDIDFIRLWKEISEALLRIATNISPAKRDEWEKSIDDLLRNPLKPDGERCIEELETWYKQDMDIKDEFVKLRKELSSISAAVIDLRMDLAGFHQAAGLEPTLPEPEQAAGADDPDPPDISVWDVLLPFKEAVGFFSRYLRCKLRPLVRHNELRSLPMTVECSSSQDHEGLCEDFQSGHLNSVAQEMLRTPQVLEKLGVTELKTFTAEYQCEKGTKLSEASSGAEDKSEIQGALQATITKAICEGPMEPGEGYLDKVENYDAEPPMITKNRAILTPGEAEDSKDATVSKIVTSDGATLSVKGVTLIFPPGAVKDPVIIQLTLEEPYRYCHLITRCGLQNDLMFLAPIVNCQPNGQKFKNQIIMKVTLNGKRAKSHSDLLVLHGTCTGQSQKPNWEDITDKSKFDFKTKELKVKINQFSSIIVLVRLTWVRTKEIVTRLNLMPFSYKLSVLLKSNQQQSPSAELALAFMSQDTYQEEYYRDHDDYAIMRLKKEGFEELPIDCRNSLENNSIYNKEILTISIQLGEDYKPANNQRECFEVVVDSTAWWNAGHVIKLPLQVSNAKSKIFCGKILVKGEYGHVRENKFCQQDLCGYVRHVLAVKRAIFDVKSVAQKLELPVETQQQVVACWQGEEEQLELAIQHWREKHGDAANPNNLKKALEELEPEEFKVKERGQMHIEHLRDLAFKIAGLRHQDSDLMKYFGREVKMLCGAVLRDCCIENATSKGEVESATQTENFASVLVMKKRLPESVGKTCTRMFSSQEDEVITSSFLCIVSELIQAIKEIFREEQIQRTPSGLRGVTEEATLQKITSGIQGAAHDKNVFKLFSEVCHILTILCHNNNDDRQKESRIQSWRNCAMMAVMLFFLERFFQSTDARKLYKRLEFFSFSVGEVMSNPTAFDGSFLGDFHNVAVSLLKFAKFDPTHLVQFELKDPTNSISNQTKDDIKYDMSKEMFCQHFWMIKESEEILQLEATAHVHIGGHPLTIGAFEAVIVLPESSSEVVKNAPITSFPVSFKSETDGDSGNLRVTLYSKQKDDISKALEYLTNALSGHLILSKQTEIKGTSLKLVNVAEAGADARLRLIHRWGSGTIEVESKSFVLQPLGYSSPESQHNLELTDEPDQPAVRESSLLSGTSESIADYYNSGNNFMTGPPSAELIPFSPSTTKPTVIVNNYINHTVNMEGHVCVAGENTSLNVQAPSSAVQRFLEAGPGAATNRSITAGANEDS